MAITELLKRFELTDTESTNIVKVNCKTSGDKKSLVVRRRHEVPSIRPYK